MTREIFYVRFLNTKMEFEKDWIQSTVMTVTTMHRDFRIRPAIWMLPHDCRNSWEYKFDLYWLVLTVRHHHVCFISRECSTQCTECSAECTESKAGPRWLNRTISDALPRWQLEQHLSLSNYAENTKGKEISTFFSLSKGGLH